MTPKTNLQYADHPAPGVQPDFVRAERHEKQNTSRAEIALKTVAAVHDFLTEKERHACNRATD